MKEANHLAAVEIFEKVNASLLPQNVLDLHGLHVDEAIEHLTAVLQQKTEGRDVLVTLALPNTVSLPEQTGTLCCLGTLRSACLCFQKARIKAMCYHTCHTHTHTHTVFF